MLQNFPERWALSDNTFEAVLRADLWFEIDLIGLDPGNIGKSYSCEVFEIRKSNTRAHNLLPNLTLTAPCKLLNIRVSSEGICSTHSQGTRGWSILLVDGIRLDSRNRYAQCCPRV